MAHRAKTVPPTSFPLTSLASTHPNLTLLDVGAGSGTITASFAPYMPPNGRIIAADINPEILAKAAKHADSLGVGAMLTTQVADVYALPFEDGSFDVVHASMILAHLTEPGKAVKEMCRVAKKPGGVVSLRESDLRMWSIYPESPPLLATSKIFCAVHAAKGATVNAGAQLVKWALEAGVPRSQIVASAGTWCYSTPEERRMWGETMTGMKGPTPSRAVEMGLVTEEGLKEMVEAWKEWVEAEDGWFGSLQGRCWLSFKYWGYVACV